MSSSRSRARSMASRSASFNVSSLTAGDHEWMVMLHKLTGGDRSVTGRLLIEITETMAIADLDETAAFVDGLKEMGCTVALDDFGAGYTSFRNLKALAVDMIKLDGSFVKNLKDDKANRIFVQSMVTLARNFGMATVAEMVGDAETADILTGLGVDFLQGYYFGKPEVAPLPLPGEGSGVASSSTSSLPRASRSRTNRDAASFMIVTPSVAEPPE